MSLIIDYPWYFTVLCLLLGAAYAYVLYYLRLRRKAKEGKSAETEPPFGKMMTLALAALRCLAVAMIAFLLLSPLIKRESSRKEKPIVVIAYDNSKSLDYSPDSAYYHGDFAETMQGVVDKLSADYDVQLYTYGSDVTSLDRDSLPSYAEKSTDISMLLSDIRNRYFHRNVGAVVITGDGIFNSGINPLGESTSLPYPVYTIAMGDTTVRRDASIANVRFNRIAYLNNKFPMDITVNATRMRGESSTLTVSRDGRTLFSKQINYTDDHFTCMESILLDADRAGLHNYVVTIAPLSDEQTTRNNHRVIPIEIIDGHQKIAIVAAAPHPDIAALRQAIESNSNYEAETFLAKDFHNDARDYSLVILHQLPSKAPEAAINLEKLLETGTPVLFVIGSQTDLARFNSLHTGLEIFSRIDRQNDASALTNANFTYFTLDENIAKRIEQFPPLLSPFGEYKLSGNAQTLFNAKIGNVNSGLPLVSMTQQQERRYSFIAGEGLWRWRLADFQANASHDNFNELIDKIVIFTALRVNKDRFHIEVKNIFGESEPVMFEAQLYNDNYESVNTPDVELAITQQQGDGGKTQKKYLFNRTASAYSINLGILEPGSYNYTATTHFNGKTYTANGSFLVENLQLEALNLVADHSLMTTLAANNGGEMLDAHDAERLPELLKQRDDIKTVIYGETRYSDMLNLPLVFIIIVLLLAAEWVLRKLQGEV